MSESDYHPTVPFALWANAFSPAELDRIEALGDALTAQEATIASAPSENVVKEKVRVTRTAWLAPSPDSKWIYERMQRIVRTLNDRVYRFDLSGFSESLQYTVYHASESGHYDWHVDHGPLGTRRKLSISVQLSDPSSYEGCDLEFHAGNTREIAPRERGTVIAFPSYVLHRVTPCTKGTRKAIVAWTTGPQFR
jgi:PKHD-type hydroxylase